MDQPKLALWRFIRHTEFHKMDGELPFDALFEAASEDVKIRLDIVHARRAGADPIEIMREGRVVLVHVKEYSPHNQEATVGDGSSLEAGVLSAGESRRDRMVNRRRGEERC